MASWGKSDRLRRLWNARSLIASKAAAVGASTRNRAGGGRTRSCAKSRIPLSASQFAPGSGSDGGSTLTSFVVRLVRHPDMLATMTAIGTSRCLQHFSARSNFPPTNGVALYSLFRARPGSGFQRIDKLGWFVFERIKVLSRGATPNSAPCFTSLHPLSLPFTCEEPREDGCRGQLKTGLFPLRATCGSSLADGRTSQVASRIVGSLGPSICPFLD